MMLCFSSGSNTWCVVCVVRCAPLSVALLISLHHLLLCLISHLSVLLAQAEFQGFLICFVFVFCFWCLSYLYGDSFLLLIKTVFFFQVFGSMGLCSDIFIKSTLKFTNPLGPHGVSFYQIPFTVLFLHMPQFLVDTWLLQCYHESCCLFIKGYFPELKQTYFPCTV